MPSGRVWYLCLFLGEDNVFLDLGDFSFNGLDLGLQFKQIGVQLLGDLYLLRKFSLLPLKLGSHGIAKLFAFRKASAGLGHGALASRKFSPLVLDAFFLTCDGGVRLLVFLLLSRN